MVSQLAFQKFSLYRYNPATCGTASDWAALVETLKRTAVGGVSQSGWGPRGALTPRDPQLKGRLVPLHLSSGNPVSKRCLSNSTCTATSGAPQQIIDMVAASLGGATRNLNSILKQPLPEPKRVDSSSLSISSSSSSHVLVKDYWLRKGGADCVVDEFYVVTDSVSANLKDLSRVVSAFSFPVLIQGETSVGKTSLIQYLADSTGNHCVRINNHEHTDIQEYVGSYGADAATGALVYQDGVLVEAMRKGKWEFGHLYG